MSKKILSAMALFFIFGATCLADDYSYLTIQQNDTGNTETSVVLSSLSKITFSNGSMNLYNTSGTSMGTYSLSALNMMFFSSTATGIQSAAADGFSAALQGGVLKISSPAASKINLYMASGALVKSISSSAAETEIYMSSLPKGIYLLKVNNQVKKILNR